jgi:hypothetical protein
MALPSLLLPFSAPVSPAARIARVSARYEIARRMKARTSLHEFYRLLEPDYLLGDWIADLLTHLEWWEAAPDARLMVFAPPRHSKSQSISRTLPPWVLGRDPRAEVMLLTSTQDLSDDLGRYVRNKLNDPVVQEVFPKAEIDASANSVDKVLLKSGGGFRAVGVGGQIVGRGATHLIVDDPYKNRAQAYSASEREKLANWYRTDARTRLAPGGRIAILHQRWHVNDLASGLLKLAESDPHADQWRVVVYPATCEDEDTDPIRRKLGEPLDPVRWPIKRLHALRATMTETEWLALFQQRPVKEEGGFFKAEWFQHYNQLPSKLTWYIGVDGAASTNTAADKTAIIPIGFDGTGDGYVAPDFVLARIDTLEACNKLLDLVVKYKAAGICVEKGMYTRSIEPFFKQLMLTRRIFVTVYEIARTEGKHIVAIPLQARMNQRKVWFPDTEQMRREVRPQFLNFLPDADNDEDDFIDGAANVYQAMDKIALPMPDAPLPVLSDNDNDEEDARWKKILANGREPPRAAFTRLNGSPLRAKKA